MSSLLKALFTIQLLLFSFSAQSVEVTILKASGQRVIFETEFGNLVFSLYPDIAPQHVAQITRLVETGAYDSTHFFRVMPGFVIQLSDIYDRRTPVTTEQRAANQRLPGEFSPHMKHRAGVLSMARETDDPDSATSSFSILLGKAPHLDGKYTIFGELESGNSVIKQMLAVPRNDEAPSVRLSVNRAYIINDPVAYYKKSPRDPVNQLGSIIATEEIVATMKRRADERTRLVVIMMTAIIVVSLIGFFLYKRISKERLLSLLLVDVLIAVFLLFILLTPEGHKKGWLAALVFVGLFSTFRLMSNFERKRD
jgi:cyclophilin family peptidyl-prolyl cis-trans isomerase